MDKEHIIQTARAGIDMIERERKQQKLSQEALSEDAHPSDVRKHYRRAKKRGDVALGAFLQYARIIGYDVALVKKEKKNAEENKPGV